jgi:hypothetical protein
VVTTFTDAIFWKRGPSYTFTVLSLALMFCQHLDCCWIFLHLLLATYVILTGVYTKFGQKTELVWPKLFHTLFDPPSPPQRPPLPNGISSSSNNNNNSNNSTGKEEIEKTEKDEKIVESGGATANKKMFSGLSEITMRCLSLACLLCLHLFLSFFHINYDSNTRLFPCVCVFAMFISKKIHAQL